MPLIRVLPETLVNQIAAGEVIERPASVVKELLENALDAGAGRVTVELEKAGKALIRVSDDGQGMAPEDVPLALASHATSKVTAAEDLEAITTLGFRGEALASIASVADVRLVSRPTDALEATEVEAGGGRVGEPRPAAGPVGTTVEVRNLFRYIPARRKFLKTDATEMGHCTEQVTRAALAYPAVHLAVAHNGRTVYELPPAETVRERVTAFFGAELGEALVTVEAEGPAGRITGLVAPPPVGRATGRHQYLFVNGRYVWDRSLLHALREAYRGLLEGRQQPVAFLFLTVPPERVDVNVHPTKTEVRLRDGHLLYGEVLAAIREKLLGPGLAPHVRMPGADGDEAAEGEDARSRRVREALADFLRAPPQQHHMDFHRRRAAGCGSTASSRVTPPPHATGHAAEADSGGTATGARPRAAAEAEGAGEGPALPHAIQIHNTYLVAETADGIVIVDQHALHERVLFEDLMARLEAGPLQGQRLLVPVTVDATDREMAAAEEHTEALARLGMDVAALGPRTLGVRSVPTLLAKADPEATLRDFLAWVLECDDPPTARQVLEQLAHVAACRAAVKAGDPLQPEEVRALLAHREAARLASTCPHGRPTALVLSKSDLEKQFGRDYAAGGAVTDEGLPF